MKSLWHPEALRMQSNYLKANYLNYKKVVQASIYNTALVKHKTEVMLKNELIIGFILSCFFYNSNISAQKIKLVENNLTPVQTELSISKIKGDKAVRVTKNPEVVKDDEATYAKVNNINFKDGIIEIKVLSRLLSNAPDHARGFIGLAFRINDDNTKFECIYLRPLNSESDDQLRRNRTVQYFSFPDFKFTDSRAVSPGLYETYADIFEGEWIDMKIKIEGTKAVLFLNGEEKPSLIVNDLKHGAKLSGSIGLFVDIGTEGFFKDLKITYL